MNPVSRVIWNLSHLRRILLIALILPIAYWSHAVAGKEQDPQPLWEIDLSKFAYQGKPTDKGDEGAGQFWEYRQNLAFTQENVLATSFQVQNETLSPSVRNHPLPTDRYHMVAVFLDSQSGETIRKADWPVSPSLTTSFFAGQKGQFVVGIGTKFSVYSPDLSVIAEKTLPSSYPPLETMESPLGDTFLVYYIGGPEVGYKQKLDLVDTTDLSVLGSWTGDLARPPWSLWGVELARFSEHDLQIATPGSEPKHFAQSKDLYRSYLSFINQKTLAVGKLGKDDLNAIVVLISTDGTVLNELRFDPKGLVEPAVAARNGKVFAIPSYVTQKAPARPTVRVFRLGSEAPILTLDVVPSQGRVSISMGRRHDFLAWWWNAEWGGVALSPQGDLLAVRAGPIVRVYPVPQAP